MGRVARVLIQKERGEFSGRNTFVAYLGFEQKGYEVVFAGIDDIRTRTIELNDETIAVGGIGFVKESLAQVGCELPPPIDYPDCLKRFLGRRVWQSTWKEIRSRYAQSGAEPLFVKPTTGLKAFTGTVVSQFRDLIPTAHYPNEMELTASEPVRFVSEWRYFVHHHEIVGVGHYSGDPLLPPDSSIIREAVAIFRPSALVAYGIDFGVTDTGKTLLVEVNDGYSLGSYGLPPVRYATMLEDRWTQMVLCHDGNQSGTARDAPTTDPP